MGNAIDVRDDAEIEVFSRGMFLEALDKQGVGLEFLAKKVKQFLDSDDEKVAFQTLKVVITELIGNKAQAKDGGFEQQMLRYLKDLKEQERGKRPAIS
jgi:hypothetical protein